MPYKKPAPTSTIDPVALASGPLFGSMDNLGRIRTSKHQNIYEADFEYGTQPMRWENYIVSPGSGSSIAHLPGQGGCRMRLSTVSGDITIRQSRPYHRYQPGKSMVMSTAVNFGTAQTNQRQRVGFFDEGNGMFLEQGDPVATATTFTSTGNLISGNNVLTGLSSTATLYYGTPVQGIGIDPTVQVTVNQVINSTAVSLSSPAYSSQTGTNFSFSVGANPSGMFCVVRSDVQSPRTTTFGANSGTPSDLRIPLPNWNGDKTTINSLDWTRIQMVWMEYTWYGAGMTRWGIVINGEWIVLNYVGFGNLGPANAGGLPNQSIPWARTGNLPVRYEQRNLGTTVAVNDMLHWGVSVIVEGGQDGQRGFTYSYGMGLATPRRTVPSSNTRYPVLSISSRTMGVVELSGNATFNAANASSNTTAILFTTANTSFDTGGVHGSANTNALVGRHIYFPGQGTNGKAARVTGSNSTVITFGDIISGGPIANTATMTGTPYQIGLINRGQLLPQTMVISADNLCLIELITSTTSSPIALTGATWATLANTVNSQTYVGSLAQANVGVVQAGLGSNFSFAQRDVTATAMTGGEVVLAQVSVSGSGVQQIDLSYFFPLYNTIAGATPDVLTVAITTGAASSNVGVHLIGQEAMS
jgi:hypothetical protein